MRKERGACENSGAHAIDKAFTEKGVDCLACFDNDSFLGPRSTRNALELQKAIVEQERDGLLKMLKRSKDSNQRNATLETEVKEEMEFFGALGTFFIATMQLSESC
jgi:hypothetical protein